MKKTNIPEEVEPYKLTEAVTILIPGFINGFVKESRGKGHIEIRKESPKFIVTMRVERKKEKQKMVEEKKLGFGNHRIHCSECGRFVGKDGFADIFYDVYMGGYEEGYSLCAACLKKQKEKRKR